MSKIKKIVLCILAVLLLTSTVYGKKKSDNDLIKVFISSENFDLDSKQGLFRVYSNWEQALVYKQLKKLKTPFTVLKEEKGYDLLLILKTKDYEKRKIGGIKYSHDHNGWAGKINFQESFSLDISIIDSYGNLLDIVQINFSWKSYTWGYQSSKKSVAGQNAEGSFDVAHVNVKKEVFQKIYQTLVNNEKIKHYSFYSESLKNLNKTELTNGTINKHILWTGHLCEDKNNRIMNPFSKIRETIQHHIDQYLAPRIPIDITTQIPDVISKLELPALPKLVKGQFETKIMFDERVNKAMNRRQLQIHALQEKFRIAVETRNKIVGNLQIEYSNDLETIKNEQKQKNEVVEKKISEFTQKAFFEIMGMPQLINPEYNAETGTMYIDLKASNANYQKRISVNVPLSIAETFYNDIQSKFTKPMILYSIEENTINLEQIEVYSEGEYYTANLTEEDFKPEIIEVVLEDKKIEFNSEQQTSLKFQNPNLTDTYQVSAIQYGESSEAKGLSYDDDLTPIVEKLESNLVDSKKWLFIIAVENYDETDPVVFSKNSAELFRGTAQKVFGIKERNTYALIENDATSGKIKDKLQRLIDNVKEGDIIYFYYSGHGVPVPKTEESFILPKDKIVDYISKESEFNLSNIYKKLSDSKAETVFAFIDACFSGKTDNIPIFKGVAPGLMKTKKIRFNKDKMVIITAGKDNQFSNSFDEKGHRMFSYYLIKSLATRKNIDIDLLYKDISVKVHDASFEKGDVYIQEPQIYGNKKLNLFNKE